MEPADNRGKGAATFFAIAGTVGHLVLMILAGIAASAIGGRQLWTMIQEAGWFIWLLIPGAIVFMVLLAGVGLWFARRADSWSWVPILPSSLIMLTAVAGTFYSMMKVEAAISGESVDPSQKARILAQGIAESLNLTLFGSVLALFLACAAAMILAARALARVGKKRVGTASGVALLVGVLSLVVIVLARFVWPDLAAAFPFGLYPSLVGVVTVTVAALSLTGPREGLDNPAGALGDAIVAGLCGIAGVAMAAIAVRTQLLILGFGALAGVDPANRMELLSLMWSEANRASYAHLLFAAPIVLALLGPLGVRLVYLGRALVRTGGGVVGVIVATALAVALPYVQGNKLGLTLMRMADFPAPADVTLPQTTRPDQLVGATGSWVWIGRDNVAVFQSTVGKSAQLDTVEGCNEIGARLASEAASYGGVNLGVDASTPYQRLACVLMMVSSKTESGGGFDSVRGRGVGLALQSASADVKPLAPPFNQARPQPGVLQVPYIDALAWTTPNLHVHLSPGAAMTRAGKATDGQTKQGSDAELLAWLKTKIEKVRDVTITADPAMPSGMVIAVAALRDPKHVLRLGPAIAADKAFDLGAPPPPPPNLSGSAASSATPPTDANAPEVAGQLDAEVIKRVVNQNRSKLRACYEKGLAKDPGLEGKVVVDFTIGRTGKVSIAKARESTIADPKVTQCVEQTFRAMTFPKPQEGVVNVAYPITFKSDS